VLKADKTGYELLLGIPMILVNLVKASTNINRAGKWLLGVRLLAETGGKIST
jgi:hypothetical protein